MTVIAPEPLERGNKCLICGGGHVCVPVAVVDEEVGTEGASREVVDAARAVRPKA